MKLKTTIGIGLIGLLASYQTIAQNVDTHLIKKNFPFYHPIVDFDGDGNQDFLRVKRSKDKQTIKLYFEKNENTPETYLGEFKTKYRHELKDVDNDGDLDLTEKIWNGTNKNELSIYKNNNNELEPKKFAKYITNEEFYK